MEKVTQKSDMWRHRNEWWSISFLGVLFHTPPFISLIFMTSHVWFLSDFLHLLENVRDTLLLGLTTQNN